VLAPSAPKLLASAPRPLGPARAPAPLAAKPALVATPKPVVAAPPKVVATAADPARSKGKYTLQLSAFPTRDEADTFAKRFAGQGTFIITSEIPGKGTWYRVRCGNFSSYQEATAAKASFERQNKVIALIAAR
jgi:septal ring-binding cell division protein DamX